MRRSRLTTIFVSAAAALRADLEWLDPGAAGQPWQMLRRRGPLTRADPPPSLAQFARNTGQMRCAISVLVCATLVAAAPNLLPGDPRLAEGGDHHGDHADHHADHSTAASTGVPDIAYQSDGSAYGVGEVVTSASGPVRSTFPVQPSAPPPQQQPQRPAGNPFFSGNVNIPSFSVAPKPKPSPAERPSTPAPLLNTNPLGGPAGFKGAVRESCPAPPSALPCVPDAECDPYTGFLKSDGIKLPYPITKDTPTVAIDQCKLSGGRIGVCCKKFPKPPKPTPKPTALPLGVDYGEGLPQPKPTERVPNPFIPGYNP